MVHRLQIPVRDQDQGQDRGRDLRCPGHQWNQEVPPDQGREAVRDQVHQLDRGPDPDRDRHLRPGHDRGRRPLDPVQARQPGQAPGHRLGRDLDHLWMLGQDPVLLPDQDRDQDRSQDQNLHQFQGQGRDQNQDQDQDLLVEVEVDQTESDQSHRKLINFTCISYL